MWKTRGIGLFRANRNFTHDACWAWAENQAEMITKHDAKIDIIRFMVAPCLIPDEILDLFYCGDDLSWLLFDEAALAGGRQVPMDLS